MQKIMNFGDLSKLYILIDPALKQKLFLNLKKKYGLWKYLIKEFPYSYTAFYMMRTHLKTMSYLAFKRLLELSNLTFFNNFKITSSKSKQIFLDNNIFPITPSPDLANLVGHSISDGSIRLNNSFYYYNNDINLIENVKTSIKKIFKIDLKQKKNKNRMNSYYLYSPCLIGDVLSFFGAIKGNKTLKSYLVPDWILNGTIDIKKAFLKALFDDEGHIYPKGFSIGFSKIKNLKQNLILFLTQLKQLLSSLDIKSGKICLWEEKEKIKSGFNISGYENLLRLKTLNLVSSYKLNKLNETLNGYRLKMYSHGVAKSLVLKYLSKQKLTTEQLAYLLDRSPISVGTHLRHLEDESKIRRERIGWHKIYWTLA